ncbi:MAG TPA: palindromic element RPE5 domain-containing protein [Rickettsia endosymbiont of Bembidion nr. Transversale]|nr:palindromic element RPE5 domain-containing protein [Rickettsia endosymbiont of Stiretrus anchorago]HJD66545.1 palindromic element RPE5 domain-containing protein [Rickettsia endosymbiont of Bembidion nr. Transversale]
MEKSKEFVDRGTERTHLVREYRRSCKDDVANFSNKTSMQQGISYI